MCLFCKMVKKEIPAKVLFEDDDLLAFHDINPQAPVHVLVIPKRHIVSLADAVPDDDAMLGKLARSARKVAEMTGIKDGFRTVMNTGANAGQSVFHLHMHVLGGRAMAAGLTGAMAAGLKDVFRPCLSGSPLSPLSACARP